MNQTLSEGEEGELTGAKVVHEFLSDSPIERGLRYVRVFSNGSFTLANDQHAEAIHSSSSTPFSREVARLALTLAARKAAGVAYTACPKCGVDVTIQDLLIEGPQLLSCSNCTRSFEYDFHASVKF